MDANSITDTFHRPLRDLRISVTDRSSFRCVYCMPREIFGGDYVFMPTARFWRNADPRGPQPRGRRTLQSVNNAVLIVAHHHGVDGWQLEYFNGEPAMAAVQG